MRRGLLIAALGLWACGAPVPESPFESSGRPAGALAVGSPVTVEVPLAGELLERVAEVGAGRAPERSVRLAVEGVEVPAGADLAIRVFVGLPEADAETSIDDAHYAGSFSFGHEAAESKTGFLLDVSRVLRRTDALPQRGESDRLAVTLVAVPLREITESSAPIRFERAVLSVR